LSSPLLVAYGAGGGIPPATYETLRVYEDGTARAVVGNAWPLGSPQDEAGSYARSGVDLAALRAELSGDFEAAGDLTADSGRCELRLGDGRRAIWPMNDPPPPSLATLVERMRALLAETRRHPVGALALGAAAVGDGLGLTLHNPGSEPVAIAGGEFRTRASANANGRADLEALVAAEPLVVGTLPDALAPGERRSVGGRIDTPAGIDVLAQLTADLPYEQEALRLECVLLAGPLGATGTWRSRGRS
jgi:hypothetical protein